MVAASGWFAARLSGTMDIYKIYAESFRDGAHLRQILADAALVGAAGPAAQPDASPRRQTGRELVEAWANEGDPN